VSIADKLNALLVHCASEDEELFLIGNGKQWCAGYGKFVGLNCEMDIRVEVVADSVEDVLDALERELV
jgi:hypothetical protein